MAADGEAYLNLAKVLEYAGKEGRRQGRCPEAIDKGQAGGSRAILAR